METGKWSLTDRKCFSSLSGITVWLSRFAQIQVRSLGLNISKNKHAHPIARFKRSIPTYQLAKGRHRKLYSLYQLLAPNKAMFALKYSLVVPTWQCQLGNTKHHWNCSSGTMHCKSQVCDAKSVTHQNCLLNHQIIWKT